MGLEFLLGVFAMFSVAFVQLLPALKLTSRSSQGTLHDAHFGSSLFAAIVLGLFEALTAPWSVVQPNRYVDEETTQVGASPHTKASVSHGKYPTHTNKTARRRINRCLFLLPRGPPL